MAQKRIVHLRVYRGERLSYDAKGNVQNETQLIKGWEDSVEYKNTLRFLRTNGFCHVEVEAVFQPEGGDYKKVEAPEIVAEVKAAFNDKPQQELSPSEKRIADLEAKLEKLTAQQSKPEAKPEANPKVEPEVKSNTSDDPVIPVLTKSLDRMSRAELEEVFPNIADIEPANIKSFREMVRDRYPGQYQ